jgi:hypothetical protein
MTLQTATGASKAKTAAKKAAATKKAAPKVREPYIDL